MYRVLLGEKEGDETDERKKERERERERERESEGESKKERKKERKKDDENFYTRLRLRLLMGRVPVYIVEGLPTSVEMSRLVINKPPTVLDTKITNCFEHASYTR